MTIQTVRVTTTEDRDPHGDALLHDVRHTLGITSITHIRTAKVFRLEGLNEAEARRFAEAVLCESITQMSSLNEPLIDEEGAVLVEVAYKPGVMNPEAASLLKAARDLGITNLVATDTSWEYHFVPREELDELSRIDLHSMLKCDVWQITERLLMNKTVAHVVTEEPKTLLIMGERGTVATVAIREADDDALLALSKDKLFLNLEEMQVIQAYFRKIDRDPTDGELETLAQTWSEHCGHKTFNATLIVDGVEEQSLMSRLKETAGLYGDNVVSSFHDNSGVVRFFDGYGICGKVETHNSPSAIEPYGGAMTGSGGVFRDIMGTGQGAKTILSTDMFCLAPWDLPADQLPSGCLHPGYLLPHVVRGVKDYGNRMGIPTANGSFHFHPDFRAKPSVIVGAYGIIPESRAQKGVAQPGDMIIALGGRTGRDGIHGATFSSAEMTERTINVNSSAVQIGHAIEEKRTFDALLACRDAGLMRALTDCGAGGFSSAIGEIGSKTGVRVLLDAAPLKYPGLAPWEIWISESQERMVAAVAFEDVKRFFAICRDFNVEAVALGTFTDDKRLRVFYHGEMLCDLEMDFLHNGLPQRVMRAEWQQPEAVATTIPEPHTRDEWTAAFCKVLGHRNVCSKEPVARLYDHSVQGTNVLPPYAGVLHDGPNDAVVLKPILDNPYGMVVSHGLNPVLMRSDPYWGAVWAVAEAIANYTAVGGDITRAGLIDNFIWPFPDPHWMGALKMSVDACIDAMYTFKVPFVSGKDSLSSTYRGKDGTVIHIPPVLCISAFGPVDDVTKTVSADFKGISTVIVLLGKPDVANIGGSVYAEACGTSGTDIPHVDLTMLAKIAKVLHQQIGFGSVLACHDVSEGGIAVALAEMCFGGDRGALLTLDDFPDARPDSVLFNETAGCFLVEVRSECIGQFMAACRDADIPRYMMGNTIEERDVVIAWKKREMIRLEIDDLKAAWSAPMKEVFP